MSDENSSSGKCDVPAVGPVEDVPITPLREPTEVIRMRPEEIVRLGREQEPEPQPIFEPESEFELEVHESYGAANRIQQEKQGSNGSNIDSNNEPNPLDQWPFSGRPPHPCPLLMSEAIEGAKNLQQNGVEVASADMDEHAAKQPDAIREASRADTEKPVFRG